VLKLRSTTIINTCMPFGTSHHEVLKGSRKTHITVILFWLLRSPGIRRHCNLQNIT